ERLLQWIELSVLREAFDSLHGPAIGPDREIAARVNGPAVQQNRTCSALTAVAANLRSGETEMIAEQFNERPAIFDVDATLRPVDGHAYRRSRHAIRCDGSRRRLRFKSWRGRRHGERRPRSLQKFSSGNLLLRFGFAHGGILYNGWEAQGNK